MTSQIFTWHQRPHTDPKTAGKPGHVSKEGDAKPVTFDGSQRNILWETRQTGLTKNFHKLVLRRPLNTATYGRQLSIPERYIRCAVPTTTHLL